MCIAATAPRPAGRAPVVFVIGAAVLAAAPASAQCPDTKLIASDGSAAESYGFAVDIHGDVSVVGAWQDADNGTRSGSAYVYRNLPVPGGSAWVQEAKLLGSDNVSQDRFGAAVAVDGSVVAVGAYRDSNENGVRAGAVYVFRHDGVSWSEEVKLIASDGTPFDAYAFTLALSGEVLLVGSSGHPDLGAASGSAYVYRYDGTAWIEEAELLASDGQEGDSFGNAVALSGDVAVIGAHRQDAAATDAGAAYIFRYDANALSWAQEQKIPAPDAQERDDFGWSVDTDGDVVIIGADLADGATVDTGAAWVYRYDPGSTQWQLESRLTASDGGQDDRYGDSVAIRGDLALVGAQRSDAAGLNAGAVYVYRYDAQSGTWGDELRLDAPDGEAGDQFGQALAMTAEHAVVGADGDDDNGLDAGAAWVLRTGACAETICPDDPDDFLRVFGGAATGDALDLCASDDMRLEILQSAQLSPLLPFIRLEYWAHSALGGGGEVSSVEYVIEAHVSALVAGGQNADTLRTSVRNYALGRFELVDERGTSPSSDEQIVHVQTGGAADYVQAGDGEVRVRQDVFDPGNVFAPNWFLKVDAYEVTVSG